MGRERGKASFQLSSWALTTRREEQMFCFAHTSITSRNLADSSHRAGALTAVQCESLHTTLASTKGTKGPQLALEKISNSPWHGHCWQFLQSPYQVCGAGRVKAGLQTASGLAVSRGCQSGAQRAPSKEESTNGHEFGHMNPEEMCVTRRGRTIKLSPQIATNSKHKQQISLSHRLSPHLLQEQAALVWV